MKLLLQVLIGSLRRRVAVLQSVEGGRALLSMLSDHGQRRRRGRGGRGGRGRRREVEEEDEEEETI